MSIQVIIVATSEVLRTRYRQLVGALGCQCLCVCNFRDLHESLKKNPCNGLILDLPTSIKADKTEKILAHDLMKIFPALRVKWYEEQQQLRCMLSGSSSEKKLSLEGFIEHHCRPFPARIIRRHQRYRLHFNALISVDEKQAINTGERSVTLNISQSGCQLLSMSNWNPNQHLWLRLNELQDPTPIEVVIRRCISWGTPMQLPGIGIEFVSLTDSQQTELNNLATFKYLSKK